MSAAVLPTAARRTGEGAPLPKSEPLTRLPVLLLEIQSRCNCRCAMCDIWKVSESREISPGQVAAWLPGWKRLGVENVVLTGGVFQNAYLSEKTATLLAAEGFIVHTHQRLPPNDGGISAGQAFLAGAGLF